MLKTARFTWLLVAALALAPLSFADDSARLLRVDHYVRVHSTVPAIAGQTSQIYVREVVQAGVALRGPATGPRGALRAWRRHARRSFVRRSLPGLQLDGVSGARGLRCVFHGHDGLRALHAARADERSLQCLARPTGRLHPRADSRALFAQLSASADHHRVGLERSGRRDRLLAFAASCRQGEPGGVVAGRAASRRLHRAASGTSQSIGVARARRTIVRAPADPPAQLPADGTTMTTQSHDEFIANWARQTGCTRSSGSGRQRFRLGTDARVRSGGCDVGNGRAARSASHHLGLECGGGRQDKDADADGDRRVRQASSAGSGARLVRRPGRGAQSLRRSGLFLTQRHVGKESLTPLPSVGGLAHEGFRERHASKAC